MILLLLYTGVAYYVLYTALLISKLFWREGLYRWGGGVGGGCRYVMLHYVPLCEFTFKFIIWQNEYFAAFFSTVLLQYTSWKQIWKYSTQMPTCLQPDNTAILSWQLFALFKNKLSRETRVLKKLPFLCFKWKCNFSKEECRWMTFNSGDWNL